MPVCTTLWFAEALTPDGWAKNVRITIADGQIAGMESGVAAGTGEERFAAALPGLANVHSHAFQRGMAGLAERGSPDGDDFWSWREVMYHFLDRLTPDDVEAIAAFAYAEMAESGFTRVGEFHYLHHAPDGTPYADPAEMASRIAAAAAASGIGLTLLPVFYAHSDFGGAAPKAGQRRFICTVEDFENLWRNSADAIRGLDGANIGVAPHSLRAVTAEELARVTALCPSGPIHIHAAEQIKEVEASIAYCGQRPVEWLLDHAGLDPRWCLIHATHLNSEETRRLAQSGAVAGLCPVTEANLGDGIFPAAEYLAAHGRVGVGTDSNILIDAAAELRGLDYAQRLLHRKRNVLASAGSSGRSLFNSALRGGAQALAAPGGLFVGSAADLIALNTHHPSLVGRQADALLDGWIFAAGSAAITEVWRGGRKIVANGRHVAREALLARYRPVMERLLG